MISLERPQDKLAASYLAFVEEMRRNEEKIWEGMVPAPDENPSQFVRRLHREQTNPGASLVQQTSFWACKDGEVVGRIALRHQLNDSLKEFGGHIGYEVRPSYRRIGIAKEMLRLVLETPKAKAIGKLLLTCDPKNVPSIKTIMANGGCLEKTLFVERVQRDTNYYWISL